MTSLKKLVELHGFNIRVCAPKLVEKGWRPFTILSISMGSETLYAVRYDDDTRGDVLQECAGCDDYDLAT